MKLVSPYLGTVEIDPSTVLEFPVPLAGFEQSRRYKLFHEETDTPIILWLQSLDEPEVMFNLIAPALLGLNFEIALSDEEIDSLQMKDPADISVFLLVSKENGRIDPKTQSPILINSTSRRGLQKTGMRAELVFRNI